MQLQPTNATAHTFTRRSFCRIMLAGAATLAIPASLSACAGGKPTGGKGTITVGSKSFTESHILAELYALALEDAGFTVKRSMDIANSVVHTAIVNGDIDLYPGYTGTALISVLKLPMQTDPQQVYDTVKDEYKKQFDLDWLDMTAANDGQGIAMSTPVAQRLNISTITDLQRHATELVFASGPEFDQREDCLPALEKAYGPFNWKQRDVVDDSLKYQILKEGKGDVTSVATTEGQLTDKDSFTLITDDKYVWPPYNVAPIVRDDVLSEHPEIADVLNDLGKKIDTDTLTQLNARVDVDKEEYEDVAQEFFDSLK